MTVLELMEQLKKYAPDREVRVVGDEDDSELWECWDMDVYIARVQDGAEHVELLVHPWVVG